LRDRISAVLLTTVIVLYMAAGGIYDFALGMMRQVSLVFLGLMVPLFFLLRRKDRASAIEKAMLGYIALAAFGFWLWPRFLGVILAGYPLVSLYAVLLVTVVVPPLLGRPPFTEHFARKRTPPEVWQTEIFRRVNLHITWAWATVFAACGLAALAPAVLPALDTPLGGILFRGAIPLGLLLGVGLPLTRYYPDYYQRKLGLEPMGPDGAKGRGGRNPTLGSKPLRIKEETMADRPSLVAVNGSPHAGIGNTSMMIEMLREPLSAEGFELDVIHLADNRIEYCVGCGRCLEKGKCWHQDDHAWIVGKLLEAKGIILASPVYFMHVTAQMKAFLDRSLAFGHRPRPTWKPGLAVSVSAGMGESSVADYLAGLLRVFGGFPVGTLTAIAVAPGEFLGKEAVTARAEDLARDLAKALKEERRYPATDRDLLFYQFMSNLVRDHRGFMKADYRHWQELGLFDGFESYVRQGFARGPYDPELRKAWIRGLISKQKEEGHMSSQKEDSPSSPSGPHAAKSCRDLLRMMPLGFKPEAAGGLEAVYQFEVSGPEDFTAHLVIADGRCTYHDGPAQRPDVTVRTPGDVWLAIARGELDGRSAYFSGKYKAEGKIGLLVKLAEMF